MTARCRRDRRDVGAQPATRRHGAHTTSATGLETCAARLNALTGCAPTRNSPTSTPQRSLQRRFSSLRRIIRRRRHRNQPKAKDHACANAAVPESSTAEHPAATSPTGRTAGAYFRDRRTAWQPARGWPARPAEPPPARPPRPSRRAPLGDEWFEMLCSATESIVGVLTPSARAPSCRSPPAPAPRSRQACAVRPIAAHVRQCT